MNIIRSTGRYEARMSKKNQCGPSKLGQDYVRPLGPYLVPCIGVTGGVKFWNNVYGQSEYQILECIYIWS
jgi:hypothetical protein